VIVLALNGQDLGHRGKDLGHVLISHVYPPAN
jgi:hypothetical protein